MTKEERKIYYKEYYKKNKEKIKEYNQKYGKDWYEKNKERKEKLRKIWFEKNKDRLKIKAHETYIKQKEEKKEKKRIPFYELEKQYKHIPVRGYENEYEIFENGALWSWRFNKFRKPSIRYRDGHATLNLEKNHVVVGVPVHRLVALSFDERPLEILNEMVVHHCNINEKDNHISNLVFLPKKLHNCMHFVLKQEQIRQIGEQVKNLTSTDKTNKFVEILKQKLIEEFTD